MHIEIAKRLIEEEQLRGRRQGARQRYALLLAPGQLVWIALCQVLQPHQPQHLDQACAAPGSRPAKQAKLDVLTHGHVRKQCVILEDHADMPLLRWHHQAWPAHQTLDEIDLAGIRLFESGYEAQQSRLTTAAWAEQADHSARFHLQGDITQYRHLRLEAFTDLMQREHWIHTVLQERCGQRSRTTWCAQADRH